MNHLILRIKNNISLIIGLSILWSSLLIVSMLILSFNNGVFVYTLDDAYIHLSLVQNYVEHGVFGISQYEFSSNTSSPLWSLLLIAFRSMFTNIELVPLMLNVLFANLLVVYMWRMLNRFNLSTLIITFSMILMMFLISIPNLVFNGMEHLLFALLVLVTVDTFSSKITNDTPDIQSQIGLLVVICLMTSIRYEGLIVSFVCAIILLMKKKKLGLGIIFSSLVSPALFGIISAANGWSPIPNSILVKLATNSNYASFLTRGIDALYHNPYMLVLLCVSLFILVKDYGKQQHIDTMSIIFLFSSIVHIQFLRLGSFYRYDSYLVMLGLLVITLQLSGYYTDLRSLFSFSMRFEDISKPPVMRAFLALIFVGLVLTPLVTRGALALLHTPYGSNNIYEQQYHMGEFLDIYYTGQSVGMNDIGAASYLADIRCIDLFGLGNLEVTNAKLNGSFGTDFLRSLVVTYNITISVIYKHWFTGMIPSEWILVGEWTLIHSYVGSDTVSFFATNESNVEQLRESLIEFSSNLPSDVLQTGNYTL